jgi:hypothetical protein
MPRRVLNTQAEDPSVPLSVSFLCKACGEPATSPRQHPEQIAGFARPGDWLSIASGAEAFRTALLEEAPRAGDRHQLLVRFPFFASTDEPFWACYRPPRAHANGWGDCPEEIRQSAIVECRLVRVSEREPQSAIISVDILSSISVDAIGSEIFVGSGSGDLFDGLNVDRFWLSRSAPFTHLSVTVEGDAGWWAVVERRDATEFLILQGDWSWHLDRFHATNRRLSEAEARTIARLAGRLESS